MSNEFFYLVDKKEKAIRYAGVLPENWANIPSVNQLNYDALRDLKWAGYPNLGFLTEADAGAVPGINLATLAEFKKAQYDQIWEQIKTEREARKAGGIPLTVNGQEYWFWSDETTRTQYAILDGYARRNALPDEAVLDDWKTMSGVKVPMTVALLHQVLDAGVAREKMIFNTAERHKTALYASPDPANYNWKADWPPTYVEFASAS